MFRVSTFILGLQLIMFSAQSQKLVSIGKYYAGYDDDNSREYFKIDKQKFAFDQQNKIFLNDSLLVTFSKDSTFEIEVYGERYVFLSMYLAQKQGSALPVERREKQRVIVYDLKNFGKRWDFHFMWHTSQSLRWFDPKRSKIKLVRENIITASIH
jgi:hypothetical protein